MSPVPDPKRPAPTGESLFDARPFLECLAEAWYPGAPAHVVEGAVDGRRYRVVEVRGHRLADVAFVDLHAPLGPAIGAEPALGHLGNAVLATMPAEAFRGRVPAPGTGVAPFVDWGRFPRYADFEALVRDRDRRLGSDTRRRTRRLVEALGEVAFYRHHEAEALLELAIGWKRAQYQRTGMPDVLAPRRNAELLRALWRRGLLEVAVLRAGTRPVALHLGATWDGVFHYWVPAYDPGFARFGPGRLLLHRLLEASYHSGHRRFDFLYGDEAYKWIYATDVRVVGPVGSPPLPARLLAPLRQGLAAAVRQSPKTRSLARRTRRYLVEHGVI